MKKTNFTFCKLVFIFIAVIGILFSSCSTQDGDQIDEIENELVVTEGVNKQPHTDLGGIGVIIDTRKIFKKGYVPVTAEITFQSLEKFNKIMQIDINTNIAIFEILNETLSDDEKNAFESGVSTTIIVKDENQNILESYIDDNLVLDDSNFPLSLQTDKEFIRRPLNLKQGIPYLIKIDNIESIVNYDGVLAQRDLNTEVGSWYRMEQYDISNDTYYQQFYFHQVEEGIYKIKLPGTPGNEFWLGVESRGAINDWEGIGVSEVDAGLFEFEQEVDGWSKLRLINKDGSFDGVYFDFRDADVLLFNDYSTPYRIRVIADDIDWEVVDKGTTFSRPIIGPANLDFAYSATLNNCSPAILTEEVGKVESKSRTTSFSTSESLQLFSSTTEKMTVSVDVEVKAKIGATIKSVGEASEEVTVSEGLSIENEYTTSETTTSENTWEESVVTTSEVSRIRTLEVPPFTAVEIADAIKSVENVITPFIQKLTISGIYKKGNNVPLTGPEIVTLMEFNLFGGIITKVNDDNIEITIRGKAVMAELFEASTDVNELQGVCDN